MRLVSLDLQGFKSFCERSVVAVQPGLSGVVGPNGCGKSNIIDALRWGLGESRAAALRGSALQDILFNGSGARQAADWCMVEMRFAAAAAEDLGMWSGSPEVVIKRELSRDGQSYFYVNNQAVRRRDVVSLFRGTGVSPRSYAVVEQGMVGSIAEASADELRQFLEETAGVSHYKDRRRDAERRLVNCQANLDQFVQLLADLQKRGESLKRQARAARKHRELSDLINDWEVLLILHKRTQAEEKLTAKTAEITALDEAVGKLRQRLESLRTAAAEARRRHAELQRAAQNREAELVRAQSVAERVRQDYEQAEQKRAQVAAQLTAERTEHGETASAISECASVRRQLESEEGGIGGELEQCIAVSERQADEMETLQEALQAAEKSLEAARQVLSEAEQRREGMRIQAQMAEAQQRVQQERLDELQTALKKLHDEYLVAPPETKAAAQRAALLEEKMQAMTAAAEQLTVEEEAVRDAWREAEKTVVAAEAERAALDSFVQEKHEWPSAAVPQRLAGVLQAEAGEWARALDAALGCYAGAYVVDSLDGFLQKHGLPPSGAGLVDMRMLPAASAEESQSQRVLLSSLIKAPRESAPLLTAWLRGVYTAETTAAAQQARRHLATGESLVTRDGAVFMRDAVFSAAEVHGGFDWQRHLSVLDDNITAGAARLQQVQRQAEAVRRRVLAEESARAELAMQLAAAQAELSESRIILGQWEERRRAVEKRRGEIRDEIKSGTALLQTAEENIKHLGDKAAAQHACEAAADAMAAAKDKLSAAAKKLENSRSDFHQANVRRRELHLRQENLKQQMSAQTERSEELSRRRKSLSARISQGEVEAAQLAESALSGRMAACARDVAGAESALQKAATATGAGEQKIAAGEREREQQLESLQRQQEQNTQLQVQNRELSLAVEGLNNSLEDLSVDEARLAARREEKDAPSPAEWSAEIDRLRGRRDKLGAINFAADNELSEILARLETMQSQRQDVAAAAAELAQTIRRIDDQTRTRLKEVYEAINREFGGLFRRLFGGGESELVMDGDSFLNARFEIRARPPGKRMFPVRMLSGGEKSATALAFIFTLMRYTPPPFCIMDEVDATLDDSRVDAFVDMLSEMAGQFQCMVVTHNKRTIESMQHLIGVTQEEKGVSKVVSVTLGEALRSAS